MAKMEITYAHLQERPFDYPTMKLIRKNMEHNQVIIDFGQESITIEHDRMELLVTASCFIGIFFGVRQAAALQAERERAEKLPEVRDEYKKGGNND